jgi:hypothetical protein
MYVRRGVARPWPEVLRTLQNILQIQSVHHLNVQIGVLDMDGMPDRMDTLKNTMV